MNDLYLCSLALSDLHITVSVLDRGHSLDFLHVLKPITEALNPATMPLQNSVGGESCVVRGEASSGIKMAESSAEEKVTVANLFMFVRLANRVVLG